MIFMIFFGALARFLISLAILAIIIYLAVKLFDEDEKKGLGTAIETAFYGALIFAFAPYVEGLWWIIALISTFAWLIALGKLFSIGWIKSTAVAVITLIVATFVNMLFVVITELI